MIRSDIRGAVKDKVKVRVTNVSRYFFGASIVSLRGDVADEGILMMFLIYDIATITIRVAAVAHVIGGIYMTSWSGPRDTLGYISPIPAFQFNFYIELKHFRLFYREAAGK